MSNYSRYTPAQRKAWGKKMAAAKASKAVVSGRGAYYTGRGAYKEGAAKKTKGKAKSYRKGGENVTPMSVAIGNAIGTALSAAGAGAGTIFAGPGVGTALGAGAGMLAGEAIKYFTGYGDYAVQNNSFLVGGGNDMPPIINSSKGGFPYRRSEYIGDVITSAIAGAFKLDSYPVNPAYEQTFQWLSQCAANYEEYVMEGLYFEFRTMSGDALNSVNTALGSVIMAANYNAAAPNFVSKQQMENYEGGVSSKPSVNCRYFLECAKNQTILDELYTRNGSVPTGQDPRLYDIANFQIATTGFQGTSVNIGELWVTYQISMRKPKLFATLGMFQSFFNRTASIFSNASPMTSGASVNVLNPANNISIIVTGTTLTFPFSSVNQGYRLLFTWTGSGAVAIVFPVFVAGTGTTLTNDFVSPQTTLAGTLSGSISYYFQIPGNNLAANNTITLGGAGTLPTGTQVFTLNIDQVPNSAFVNF